MYKVLLFISDGIYWNLFVLLEITEIECCFMCLFIVVVVSKNLMKRLGKMTHDSASS